ncbi:MAG TPA: M28 family peptidase [Bacteroidota bacterium]|nr:M28 family peptidase [Bacteroidota bacterium]
MIPKSPAAAHHRFLIPVIAIVFFLLSVKPAQASDPTSPGLEGANLITSGRLRAQLTLIASDEFEGRETGFRGQKLAALYVAQQFEQMGLVPMGDNGSYYQYYPLLHLTVDTSSTLETSTPSGRIRWTDFGTDYFSYFSGNDTSITGEIEFVGYGINSKTLHYSEYDSTRDYKGKIVLALHGTPGDDDSTSIFFQHKDAGNATAKRFYAQWSGAAAVLVVEETADRTMAEAYEEQRDELTRGLVTIPQRVRSQIPLFSISRKVADALLASSGTTVGGLQREIDSTHHTKSFPLPGTTATLTVKTIRDQIMSSNVIGLLPGNDSLLKNQVVVFSAHHDHLGKNTITGEVYNGADDDGSGTAAILEIAHAFTSMPQRPKRSILFLSVSGEEKGLLGSLYYTEHPTIPLEQTVTDLNTDMIGRRDPEHELNHDTDYVYVIGSDKLSSQLDSINRAANDESVRLHLDYTFDDESDPHQFYRRSDHYNFAKKDVPIIFYFDGEHPDYHRPSDKVEKIDFDIYLKRARLIFFTGWKIANAPHRPMLNRDLTKPSTAAPR